MVTSPVIHSFTGGPSEDTKGTGKTSEQQDDMHVDYGHCLLYPFLIFHFCVLFCVFRESDMTREKWRAIDAFDSKNHRNVGEDPSK